MGRPRPGLRSRADADADFARLRRKHAELKESTKVLHSVVLAWSRRMNGWPDAVDLTAPTSWRSPLRQHAKAEGLIDECRYSQINWTSVAFAGK
ncbi:MAG: hypothetical protein LC797_02930 [Chloroflexi bacterium]|nr:hypothetical protein [Chloroflexota bacterium]